MWWTDNELIQSTYWLTEYQVSPFKSQCAKYYEFKDRHFQTNTRGRRNISHSVLVLDLKHQLHLNLLEEL